MEFHGHFAPGGCASRGRWSTSAPRRRAISSHRRARARDPLFQYSNPVAQLRGQLKVFTLDRAAQLCLQLEQAAARIVRRTLSRHLVALADMLAGPVQFAQKITQMSVEGHVALVAAKPSGVAEVPHRAATDGTP